MGEQGSWKPHGDTGKYKFALLSSFSSFQDWRKILRKPVTWYCQGGNTSLPNIHHLIFSICPMETNHLIHKIIETCCLWAWVGTHSSCERRRRKLKTYPPERAESIRSPAIPLEEAQGHLCRLPSGTHVYST